MKKSISKTAEYEIRLESFLHRELSLTKRQISQAKFRENGILVNGTQVRVTAMLHPGDVVSILLEEEMTGSAHLNVYEYPLEILYEDEDILAVNKPAGMVVHPSHGHYQDTLSNAIAFHYKKQGVRMKIRSIGRLDKDTSGIVLFAKNQTAAARLFVQKQTGIFQKTYLALIQGTLEHERGSIRTPLERDTETLMKMKTASKGLTAVTHYQIWKPHGDYTAVLLHLETGRTHQIRVHMASIGHPLLGDCLYHPEADTSLMNRTALHAMCCSFVQPFTDEKITVKAAIPKDMDRLLIMNGNTFL